MSHKDHLDGALPCKECCSERLGTSYSDEGVAVHCKNCGQMGPFSKKGMEEAIRLWNEKGAGS